jgi:hypothetical protein
MRKVRSLTLWTSTPSSAPTASWMRVACSWSPAFTDRSSVSTSEAVSTMSIATTTPPAHRRRS